VAASHPPPPSLRHSEDATPGRRPSRHSEGATLGRRPKKLPLSPTKRFFVASPWTKLLRVAEGVPLRGVALTLALLASTGVPAHTQETTVDFGGRLSSQLVLGTYPEDSLFRDLTGPESLDGTLELRLNLGVDRGPLGFDASYQLMGLFGDTVDFARDLPEGPQALLGRYPQDRARLFDLTYVFRDEGRSAILNRLDRLAVGYTGDKAVARFGRQALTWGNGMIYTPMDILNPFDPTAVDREYKLGDDMLYGQVVRDNGDDLQGVVVFRRNVETGDVDPDWSSAALKYHGFAGPGEYDLLAARHFDQPLYAVGGNVPVGGAVWRGDVVVTLTDTGPVATAVTSMSYSWVWGGKNMSGVAEYFFSGFGQPDGQYDPQALAQNPELVQRLARGDLFTLGRHYVALSTLMELHPLFHLTPNVFVNLSDGSALVQVVTQNDLKEDLLLLGAVGLPLGGPGTEFGGIDTEVPGLYLSRGPSLYLQLNWYF